MSKYHKKCTSSSHNEKSEPKEDVILSSKVLIMYEYKLYVIHMYTYVIPGTVSKTFKSLRGSTAEY